MLTAIVAVLAAVPAGATQILLSTSTDEQIGTDRLSMDEDDVVFYDTDLGTAHVFVDVGGAAGTTIDVDAVHLLSVSSSTGFQIGDSLIFSVADANETIQGVKYQDEDLIKLLRVDDTGMASDDFVFSLFQGFTNKDIGFDGSTLPDIDAASVLDNGHAALSTTLGGTIGSTSFDDNELVEFIPPNSASSLIDFNPIFEGGSEDVDAAHVLANGYAFSTTNLAEVVDGSTVTQMQADDVVHWDPDKPQGERATLLLAGDATFKNAANIDALYIFPTVPVPEPDTIALLAMGLLGIILCSAYPRRCRVRWQGTRASRQP